MAALIPEKRADRNGRMVTRHVRAPGHAPSASLIPPVAPLKSRTNEVLDFQKLTFLYGATGNNNDVHQLFPVAGIVARALEAGDRESIRDMFRYAVDPYDSDWPLNFAVTCDFISRIGGASDASVIDMAVHQAAKYYRLPHRHDLLQMDEKVKSEVDGLLHVVNKSQFLSAIIANLGDSRVEAKRDAFLEYLCARSEGGTLQESVPALLELDGFLSFWDDEHEEPEVLDNLDYRKLVEMMEYVRGQTELSPKAALNIVRSSGFKVDDALSRIEAYDGAAVLIDGIL